MTPMAASHRADLGVAHRAPHPGGQERATSTTCRGTDAGSTSTTTHARARWGSPSTSCAQRHAARPGSRPTRSRDGASLRRPGARAGQRRCGGRRCVHGTVAAPRARARSSGHAGRGQSRRLRARSTPSRDRTVGHAPPQPAGRDASRCAPRARRSTGTPTSEPRRDPVTSSTRWRRRLAAWGKVAVIEARGRDTGRLIDTPVGFVRSPMARCSSRRPMSTPSWARNLLADRHCRVTIGDSGWQYEVRSLPDAERACRAVVALILRYGTPAERLGAGPGLPAAAATRPAARPRRLYPANTLASAPLGRRQRPTARPEASATILDRATRVGRATNGASALSFDDLGLSPEILRAVRDEGYTDPTPVQEQSIPIVLAGHDLMAPRPDRHRQDRRVRAAHPGAPEGARQQQLLAGPAPRPRASS